MALDVRSLRQFLKTAEMRSMSRAAEELSITQPALSYSIRTLEDALGTKLFERTSTGLTLTAAGQRLEVHARGILRAVEQAEADLRRIDHDPAGPVGLGITIGLAELLSIRVLETVRERYPKVMLSVLEMPSGALVEKLKVGEIDVALSFVSEKGHLLSREKLTEDRYFFCGRRDKLAALGIDRIAIRDLCDQPLVMMSARNGQRALVEAAASRQSRTLNVVAEIDSTAGLKRAMLAGLGFSVFPLPSLFPELGQGRIGVVPIVEPEIRRPLFLSTLRHGGQLGGVRAVRDVVRELVAALVSDGTWSGARMDAVTRTPVGH